jgi:enoyl-[acyl-carrier protein] reductase I
MGFLAGKRAVIIGLASNRSIAWGIAQAMRREGADLALSFQTDKLRGRVESMATELGSDFTLPLDVAEDAQIDAFFAGLAARWDGFDILVHSLAFAPADQLEGRYLDSVSREGFRIAHDISSYSLAALARKSEPMMRGRSGALLTLTYLGAVRTLPNYNVMGLAKASLEANVRFLATDLGASGIRINAISAGPIRTLAASGIKGIRDMIAHTAKASPLRRNVTIEDVGNAAAFLCSDLAAGITGQIIYVDAGYNIVGMPVPNDSPPTPA